MSCKPGVVYNIPTWIEENKPGRSPCMQHQDQLKIFFLSGGNWGHKDFHLEAGEELFYMRKGDMTLKVVERGNHRDIIIKEGHMYLLPSLVPHSPQRHPDTMGMVIERGRAKHEKDAMRFYVEEGGHYTTEGLYEEWFHCVNLSQVPAICKRFLGSEQHQVGKPIIGIEGDLCVEPPLVADGDVLCGEAFDFHQWLDDNKEEIDEVGYKSIYPDAWHSKVCVYGRGETSDYCKHAETLIWQLEGECNVSYGNINATLKKDDNFLVPLGEMFTVRQELGSYAFVFYQDPSKSTTWDK